MDLKSPDEEEEIESGSAKTINYERNRRLFLLQSVLLGISYAIVWPTLWKYISNFDLNKDVADKTMYYGAVFVAYPTSSMITAYLVEKSSFKNKVCLFKLVNLAEIIGNLIFALNFHPVLPFFGRLIAGMGDAFYIVIAKNMCGGAKTRFMASEEWLAAFILGLIISQPLNALTLLVPFKVGDWKVNSSNYPGLTTSILFMIMALLMRFFLSEGDDEIPEVPAKRTTFPDQQGNWKIKTVCIAMFSFIHTYIVSLFEVILPMILHEKFHGTELSSMLLYGFMILLYTLVLMLIVIVKHKFVLEIFVVFSVIFKVIAMFAILGLLNGQLSLELNIICLVLVMIVIAIVWANDEVMYGSLIATLIPTEARDFSHHVRKVTSKVAFIIAGISVPFLYWSAFKIVGPILMCLLGVLLIACLVLLMFGRSGKKKK